jgi:hypothetical protein
MQMLEKAMRLCDAAIAGLGTLAIAVIFKATCRKISVHPKQTQLHQAAFRRSSGILCFLCR